MTQSGETVPAARCSRCSETYTAHLASGDVSTGAGCTVCGGTRTVHPSDALGMAYFSGVQRRWRAGAASSSSSSSSSGSGDDDVAHEYVMPPVTVAAAELAAQDESDSDDGIAREIPLGDVTHALSEKWYAEGQAELEEMAKEA
jgi:hypothetical protein